MTDATPQDAPLAPAPVGPSAQPPRGYIAESFGTFFADPTWFRRALIGMVVLAVPILGSIAVRGYSLRWMRETAWGGGDTMPVNPAAEDTLMGGLRVFWATIVWGFFATIVLLAGTFIGVLTYLPITEPADSQLTSKIAAAVVGAMFALVGLAFFLVSMVLAEVGMGRIAIYQRAAAGMPFAGLRAFYRLHASGFWRALGTGLLAGLPIVALEIPVYLLMERDLLPFPFSPVTTLIYLPLYFVSFCSAMIGARAYGRWLREIDPRTLPPLDVEIADDGSWEAPPPRPTPAPSNDPFSDADE
jgi:hypothetical protein